MKIIIGCLAIIGIITLLMIGGCFGLIGYGIATFPKIPDYVNRQDVEKRYGNDLKIIQNAVNSNNWENIHSRVSKDVYAVVVNDTEKLERYKIDSHSRYLINKVGIGELTSGGRSVQCIVYETKEGNKEYYVYIYDIRLQNKGNKTQ